MMKKKIAILSMANARILHRINKPTDGKEKERKMIKSDRKGFFEFWQGLQASYTSVDLHGNVLQMCFEALSDYALADIKRAAKKHMTQSSKRPTPADLIKLMGRSDDAGDAWMLVEIAIRRIGGYQKVHFGDPIIDNVVLVMGGVASTLCKLDRV